MADGIEKLKDYLEIKTKDTINNDFLILEILQLKKKNNKLRDDFLKLSNYVARLAKYIPNVLERNQKSTDQHAVDISHNVATERYNEHTKEINKTIFSNIIFKTGKFAVVKLNKKMREIDEQDC